MNAPVSVVNRVGALLRALSASAASGLTTSALARAVNVPRPTTHRLLTSMQAEALVDRDIETGRWVLGPEMYLLGAAAGARYDVTAIAQPVVRRLAVATGESAFFSARRGDETVCLLREDGSFPIRSHVLYEGVRYPLGVASAGLAVLAYLSSREVDSFLALHDLAIGHGTTHAEEPLRRRIAETRAAGYALNPGLIVEGSWGMAAAVFDRLGHPSWALSLTGIEQRFAEPRRGRLGRLLLQEAHGLTELLGRK